MIFDGLDFLTRIIKLRPRQSENCLMCKTALDTNLSSNCKIQILDEFDYSQFCGVSNYNDKSQDIAVLSDDKRINCMEYKNLSDSHLLIDVRPKCQFNICSLPQSISKNKSIDLAQYLFKFKIFLLMNLFIMKKM